MSHLPRTSASHHFGSNRTIPDQSLCCIGPTCVGFTARPHPSTPAATAPPIYSLHSVRVSLLRLPFAADTPNGTESPTQRWCIALARSLLLFLRHYVPFCTRHRRRRLYRLTCPPASSPISPKASLSWKMTSDRPPPPAWCATAHSTSSVTSRLRSTSER